MNAMSNSCFSVWFAAVLVGLVSSGCGAAVSAGEEGPEIEQGFRNPGTNSATGAAGASSVHADRFGGAGSGNVTSNTLDAACPCSRRPGANNSFKCPMGVGESIATILGSAGGSLDLTARQGASSGVGFKIDVPPTTLHSDVEVRITETTTPPPAEFVDYSPIYLVEPGDLSSQVRINLTVPYGGNDGRIPRTLAIYAAADPQGPFERVADSYVNAGFLQGSITHFGAFFAGSPRTDAEAACP